MITRNRRIVLDTETTGMNNSGLAYKGHRIIEIGAVEIKDRCISDRYYHTYIKPDRLIDPSAFAIHGISDKFLQDKPKFSDIVDNFLAFIAGAELIIHNAPFDVGFIENELILLGKTEVKLNQLCNITDTLVIARKLFPGKKNNLDALSTRYGIKSGKRELHNALLDAQILANVYLSMTGGQTSLEFTLKNQSSTLLQDGDRKNYLSQKNLGLKIIYATEEETLAHQKQLNFIKNKYGRCLWSKS